MKKMGVLIFLLAFFISIQNLLIVQVANASLNCKQVKAKVLELEKSVAVEQAFFAQYNGQVIRGRLQTEFDKSNKNKFLQKLGKIQYNNESCFTKSQYDQIKRSTHWLAVTTIEVESRTMARGKDCKNNPTSRKAIDLGIYDPKGAKREVVCDVPTYFLVNSKYSSYGKSIYEY